MLAVYMPLIPWVTWMTSVVNWFVLVIEAIIVAPIWAAAHIAPDGHDVVGRAAQGYVSALESASFFPKISSSHLKSITSSLDFHHDHSRTC